MITSMKLQQTIYAQAEYLILSDRTWIGNIRTTRPDYTARTPEGVDIAHGTWRTCMTALELIK